MPKALSILPKLLLHCLVIATLVCVALGAGPPRPLLLSGSQPCSILTSQGPDAECMVCRRNVPSDASRSPDHVPLFGLVPTSSVVGAAPHWLIPPAIAGVQEHPGRLFVAHPRARSPPRTHRS